MRPQSWWKEKGKIYSRIEIKQTTIQLADFCFLGHKKVNETVLYVQYFSTFPVGRVDHSLVAILTWLSWGPLRPWPRPSRRPRAPSRSRWWWPWPWWRPRSWGLASRRRWPGSAPSRRRRRWWWSSGRWRRRRGRSQPSRRCPPGACSDL